MLVGIAATDITPPIGGELSGFALRVGPSLGTHDPLSARAVVVCDDGDARPTAMLALDLVGLEVPTTDRLRQRIEDEVGIPAESVIIAVTHTHCGPAVMPNRPSMGATDPDYLRHLDDTVVRAVSDAWARRVPGSLCFGLGQQTTVARNRRTPGGIIDPDTPVIRVTNDAGEVLGILCGYACHPTSLGPSNFWVSADIPGVVRDCLEKVYEGATAIYFNGCGGQIASNYRARTYAECVRLGRTLAGTVIQTAEQTAGEPTPQAAQQPGDATGGSLVPDPALASHSVALTLPRLPIPTPEEVSEELVRCRQELEQTSVVDANEGHIALLRYSIEWAENLRRRESPEPDLEVRVTALRWGDFAIVSLPGEPFVELGLQIKRAAQLPVMVVGYANGSPGYVPNRSTYEHGGYEVCEAHRFYGEPAALAPEAGEALVSAALGALRAVGVDCSDPAD